MGEVCKPFVFCLFDGEGAGEASGVRAVLDIALAKLGVEVTDAVLVGELR